MPKRFVPIFGSLLVIVALVVVYFYWSNGLSQVPVFGDSAPQSPIKVVAKPQVVSTDRVSIDVTITSVFQNDLDLVLQVKTLPEMKVVGVPPSSFVAHPNQPIHMTIQLIGVPADKAESILIGASTPSSPNGGVGGAAGFYLEPQNGQWQILSSSEYGRRHPYTPAPARQAIAVSLAPQVTGADQISVGVTITPAVDVSDLMVKVTTTPGLQVAAAPTSSFVAHHDQPIHTTVRLTGVPKGNVEQVTIEAFGTDPNLGPFSSGNGAVLFLEPQNGTWLVEPAERYYQRHAPNNTPSNSAGVLPAGITTT